jgi:hypothetical protein
MYYYNFSWIFGVIHNLFWIFQSGKVIWICEKTKLPLGPPARSTHGLNRTSPGRSAHRPHFSLTRPNPNPNSLAILVAMASPPRSPPRSGYLRRSWTSSLVAFEVALDGATIYPRRFEVPRPTCSCASPTAPRVCGFGIDLRWSGIPGRVVLLAALSGGGAWLAPAWPRFGAAVAGLCHRATMDAAMYIAR